MRGLSLLASLPGMHGAKVENELEKLSMPEDGESQLVSGVGLQTGSCYLRRGGDFVIIDRCDDISAEDVSCLIQKYETTTRAHPMSFRQASRRNPLNEKTALPRQIE